MVDAIALGKGFGVSNPIHGIFEAECGLSE